MVMIPMFEGDGAEISVSTWRAPKPELRVLEGGLATELPLLAAMEPRRLRVATSTPQPRPRPEREVASAPALRRQATRRHAPAVYRRRRLVLGIAASCVAVGLGLGLANLVAPAQVPPGHATAIPGLALNGYYTVQAGDTFESVAQAVAGGASLDQVRSALHSELGSTVVVPGERIAIP
jgi:hypothetical protein